MTQAQIIEAVLQAPPERLDAVLRAAQGTDKRKPGTVKQAAEILQCNPRTVQRYADRGLLTQIRITPRRVRYDLNQVTMLAEMGAEAIRHGEAA